MKTQILNKLYQQLIPNASTIVVVALLLFAYTAWAAPSAPQATPGVISYQGTLTDSADQPITGDVDMTFRLYDAPTGGAALWEEAHTAANAVPVQDGLFHVYLGSLTPISATVWTNSPLYVGVQVGGDAEMSPREELGAVPYAMQAGVVLTVPDGTVTNIQSITLGPNAGNRRFIDTDFVDLPGASITMDTDGKPILLGFMGDIGLNTAGESAYFDFAVDGVGVGGVAGIYVQRIYYANKAYPVNLSWIVYPPAGNHTFTVMHKVTGGEGNVNTDGLAVQFYAIELKK